jgi:hypothetical protein
MLTPEDKAKIAMSMNWINCGITYKKYEYCGLFDQCLKCGLFHQYDLNDAGLCVQKMVEKGDWDDFMMVAKKCLTIHYSTEGKGWTEFIFTFVAWLFNADNFFQAMAEWLRQK